MITFHNSDDIVEKKEVVHRGKNSARPMRDEIDRINALPYCMHCKAPRIKLALMCNMKMTMRACTNQQCFAWVDMDRIKTWVRDDTK